MMNFASLFKMSYSMRIQILDTQVGISNTY